MRLDKLEKLKLCTLPTPLMEAPSLSSALGGPRILIKRDDLTGLAMGGNKARPMEFIMTEAKQQEADVLVAAGYQGSNWVSNLVAAARKTNMDVVLFLLGGDRKMQGNLLLYKLLGAEIRFTDLNIHERAAMYEQMDRMAEQLREKGRRPYVMYYEPVGPLGIASYVILAREMFTQLKELGITADYLFHTSGSGSTQAGLILGAKHFEIPLKVIGVMPNHRDTKEVRIQRITDNANKTAEFLDVPVRFDCDEIGYEDSYAGDAYSGPTKKGMDAIKLVAGTEGIFLDPIYSAKSMACLIDHVRDGRIGKKDTVIYYHTGGIPLIFSHSEELSA
jgi:1-aminocyclopropane-1-carboxylate deaminase/D-cysteine desulfhydrase-like pyridoxal-dependent ACC family enzyme